MSYTQKGFIVLGLVFFSLLIALMFKVKNEAMAKKELAEPIEIKAESLNGRIEITTIRKNYCIYEIILDKKTGREYLFVNQRGAIIELKDK